MKRLTTLFLSLCISIALFAQQGTGTIFEHGTLAEAVAKAAKNRKGPKLIFLDCYTSWCGPCKHMSEKIFPQEKVGAFFNTHFVNIKIDMEKGEGPALADKYKISSYPTFIILDAQGNEINRVIGGSDADRFIDRVKTAMNSENSPAARLAAYEAAPDFTKALAYLEALQDARLNSEQVNFLNKTFSDFKWYERYSHKMWPILKNSLSTSRSKILEDVMGDYSIICDAFGKDKVDDLLTQHLKMYILAYASAKVNGATKQDLQKKVEILNVVGSKDPVAGHLCGIAQCMLKDDYSKIGDILNAYPMNKLVYNNRLMVERTVLALKEKVDPKVFTYYYNAMAASSKKTAEDYAKLAETHKSDN